MPRILIALLLWPLALSAADHLLVSEIFIPKSDQSGQAFVEILNPTDGDIDLSQTYIANYNRYYEVVSDPSSSNASHFLVQFPDRTISAGQTLVIALNDSIFFERFGKTPDFSIKPPTGSAQAMQTVILGSGAKFESAKGMLILFRWDGAADLVQDIDYLPWGLSFFSSSWMDKSGVAMDGPDADSNSSTYLDDAATDDQAALSAPTDGSSLQRTGVEEFAETQSGGNGVSGHNEASEDWMQSFTAASPNPGTFSGTPGDGSGSAEIEPDTVNTGETASFTLSLSTDQPYTIDRFSVVIPAVFDWSRSANDVELGGSGVSEATVAVVNDTIRVEDAAVDSIQSAAVTVTNVTAPEEAGRYSLNVQTAVEGGTLTPVGVFPGIVVQEQLTIADIQNNFNEYDGETVTVEGVVSIGANITRDDHTDAYIQDASGRGINLFYFNTIFDELERGNRVRVTGKVSQFEGTTQIGDFNVTLLETGNAVPNIQNVSTLQAANTDWEGTMIQTAGIISDKAEDIGGGTNITIDDGSNPIQLRIWDYSGLDLSAYSIGDTIGVRGVIDIYNNNPQLLVGYQQDIFTTDLTESADGAGRVTVQPDSAGKGQTVNLAFSFSTDIADTLSMASITVPGGWQWSWQASDVSTSGAFASAEVAIESRTVTLSAAALTDVNSGAVTLNGLTAPAVDTTSLFTVKTAGSGGLLTTIQAPPVVRVGKGTAAETIPIEEARQQAVGSAITIQGVVVIGAGKLRTNFTDAYIQDQSGYGLNIYQPGTPLDNNIKRGYRLVMRGKLDEFEGKKEIIDYTTTILETNAELPQPVELTTREATLTKHEGRFVKVSGIISSKTSAGGGTNVYVDDGSGQVTIRVWDTTELDLSAFDSGDFITVQGVISLFNNAGQILLAYPEDIFKPSFEGTPVTLDVPNKPFVPDRGEQLMIEYSAGSENTHVTIRIYDLGGRLVTTLFDGEGLPLKTTKIWDGRNQIGELVPLGAYICHLEVVNNDNGKTTRKVAPIVVGTVLSR